MNQLLAPIIFTLLCLPFLPGVWKMVASGKTEANRVDITKNLAILPIEETSDIVFKPTNSIL